MKRSALVFVALLAAALAGCQWWPGASSRTAKASPSPSPVAASASVPATSPGDSVAPAEAPPAQPLEAAPRAPAEAAPAAATRPSRAVPSERNASTSRPRASTTPGERAPDASSEHAAAGEGTREAAAEPAPAAPEPTPAPIVLAAGTQLPIELGQTLASDKSWSEQEVSAELAEDVKLGGRVVLPAGAEVLGHVVTARRSGRVKGRARLVVAFDEIRLHGKSYEIQAARWDVTAASSRDRDAKIAGGAAVAGAIIGAIAGGGKGALRGGLIGGAAGGAAVLVTRGNEVELRSGVRHKITLRSALRLD